jgi:hypothetical protein
MRGRELSPVANPMMWAFTSPLARVGCCLGSGAKLASFLELLSVVGCAHAAPAVANRAWRPTRHPF